MSLAEPRSCSVSGRRARSKATNRGATAIQPSTYKFGRGKMTTCNTAEMTASSQALLSMARIAKKGYQARRTADGTALSRPATNSIISSLT
jgi:hypothetical protein